LSFLQDRFGLDLISIKFGHLFKTLKDRIFLALKGEVIEFGLERLDFFYDIFDVIFDEVHIGEDIALVSSRFLEELDLFRIPVKVQLDFFFYLQCLLVQIQAKLELIHMVFRSIREILQN
jgi:hypothetical protein